MMPLISYFWASSRVQPLLAQRKMVLQLQRQQAFKRGHLEITSQLQSYTLFTRS